MADVLINSIGIDSDSISEELTATKSDCLVGFYAIFADSDDEVAEGTMPNSTGLNITYNCDSVLTKYHNIETGYHSGSEIIKVNPIPVTTANSSTILSGHKVYTSNGKGLVLLTTGTAGR